MNLFSPDSFEFCAVRFSDGKDFLIMQTCETTPIWAWFGSDISDSAAENAADIIADRLSKCADVQFNVDPNRAKKTLEILKNKHGISVEKRMAMTAYVCRRPVVPAAKGEMTNPTAADKETVADLLLPNLLRTANIPLCRATEHSVLPNPLLGSKRVFLWKDGGKNPPGRWLRMRTKNGAHKHRCNGT